MAKLRIPFVEIPNRITGFSALGFGLSWNPPKSERQVAKRLLTFLEDKRALYQPYDMENPYFVVQSILAIRKRLTADLEKLEQSSFLAQSVTAMQAACKKFLDKTSKRGANPMPPWTSLWDQRSQNFSIALGELRGVMGIHIAQISGRYQVDVEESLTKIFPP